MWKIVKVHECKVIHKSLLWPSDLFLHSKKNNNKTKKSSKLEKENWDKVRFFLPLFSFFSSLFSSSFSFFFSFFPCRFFLFKYNFGLYIRSFFNFLLKHFPSLEFDEVFFSTYVLLDNLQEKKVHGHLYWCSKGADVEAGRPCRDLPSDTKT